MSSVNFKVKNGIDIGVADGTPPFTTASTTLVTNLNANLLNGFNSSQYVRTAATQTITGLKTFSPVTTFTAGATIQSGGTGPAVAIIPGSIELGDTGATSTPFLDFHSSGNAIDYDSRIYAQGGTGTVGQGTIFLSSAAVTITGALSINTPLAITSGGTGQITANASFNALAPSQTSNSGKYLTTDGTNTSWATVASGGLTVSDDTTTNATRYLPFTSSTSGSVSTANVSSTKLYFNPSTGTLNATNFNSLSDLQFKTDVRLIDNALDVVNSLDGVAFKWKDTGAQSYGVIAQEIEAVIPALVDINDDGIRSVNYNGLIGFLIEAVKTLSAKVDELESR